jgi:hypothetical protein
MRNESECSLPDSCSICSSLSHQDNWCFSWTSHLRKLLIEMWSINSALTHDWPHYLKFVILIPGDVGCFLSHFRFVSTLWFDLGCRVLAGQGAGPLECQPYLHGSQSSGNLSNNLEGTCTPECGSKDHKNLNESFQCPVVCRNISCTVQGKGATLCIVRFNMWSIYFPSSGK